MKLSQRDHTRRLSVQPDPTDPSSPFTSPNSRRHSLVYTSLITDLSDDQKQKLTSFAMLPSARFTPSLPINTPARSMSRPFESHGPYCPRRPSLQEILSGESFDPWTLHAFTVYCEKNHCVENLNFMLDADKYGKRYLSWATGDVVHDDANSTKEKKLVKMWHDMMRLYVQPGAPQEVNMNGEIRDNLLSVSDHELPADPDYLKPATRSTKRLIEDSILFTFLNDTGIIENTSDEHIDLQRISVSHEDRFSKSQSVRIIPQDFDSRVPSKSPQSASAAYSTRFPKRSVQPANRGIRPMTMFQWERRAQSDSPSIDEFVRDDSSTTGTKSPPTPVARSIKSPASPDISPPPELADPVDQMRPRTQSNGSWRQKFGLKLGLKKKPSNRNLTSPGAGSPAESPFSPMS